MDIDDERIKDAVEHTEIIRQPKQSLATFGTTNIGYYLLTVPAYADLVKDIAETAVREGRIIVQRPRIVTPYYLSRLEGFSAEASRYFELLIKTHGRDVPGLFYSFRNEPKELNIVSDNMAAVIDKLNAKLDKGGDPLTSIIKGQDELWDVSLLKFIYEVTRSSLQDNLTQLERRGMLDMDSRGIPADAKVGIEGLFDRVARGEVEPRELKDELDRWGVFEEYQDRFFNIFRKRR